jgi:hypothetical protein
MSETSAKLCWPSLFPAILIKRAYLLSPFLLHLYGVEVFSHLDHFIDGRTPWTGDQFVARPLPKHRTTQTQKEHTLIQNIHVLSGIQTHDTGFRASENSSCLRPLDYTDRRIKLAQGCQLASSLDSYTIWRICWKSVRESLVESHVTFGLRQYS